MLLSLLEDEFYKEMILDGIQHTSSFNLIHLETIFKIDIFILATLAREAEESGWDGVFIWDHMGIRMPQPIHGWHLPLWR